MKVLLTLHIIAVIFLIGPLVGAANNGVRYARTGDVATLRATSRLVAIYGWASLLVAVFGMAMVRGEDKGWGISFSDGWIVASTILFVGAFLLVVAELVPTLRRATRRAEAGEGTAALVPRIAAVAGTVSVLYVVIAVLMVYGPR